MAQRSAPKVGRDKGEHFALPLRRIAEVALEVAVGYAAAGVHEEGGNNRGDQVEFFQLMTGGTPGDSWCADFVSTCLVKAFARLSGLPEDRPRLLRLAPVAARIVPVSGSCHAIAVIARGRGLLRPAGFTPLPGDLVLFDFRNTGVAHHMGFVRHSAASGDIATVEGNTSAGRSGSQADGDGVFLRERARTHVVGFVHFG